MRCSSFLNLCLSQKTFLLQKIDCVFVLAIRGLLHMTKNFVMWCDFRVLITCYGIFFEKFSFEKSWCCRKHVFVFEIVSLKDLNKVDQIIFFPVTFLGKRFRSPLWKKCGNFSVLGIDFLLES